MAGLIGLTKAIIQGPDAKKQMVGRLVPYSAAGSLQFRNAFDFQFMPETVQVSNKISWNDKDIPGLSHSLKQWTSNGGRSISFETVFSRDIRPSDDLPGLTAAVVRSQSRENRKWNIDPRYAMARLEAFTMPSYQQDASLGVTLAIPPPTLHLILSGMALGRNASDGVDVVITGLDRTYELAFENGVPRRVNVSLEFDEVIQVWSEITPFDGAKDYGQFEAFDGV